MKPKVESTEITAENNGDGGFEWDCAVPLKPDIITEDSQTRNSNV